MDQPTAPHKPSTGPSSTSRPRARLRPQFTNPSSEEPLAKVKATHEPHPKVADDEPVVKRRKRSLPADAAMFARSYTNANPEGACLNSGEHGKVVSIPLRKRSPRTTLAPSSVKHDPETLMQEVSDDSDVPLSIKRKQLGSPHDEDVYAQQKRKITKLEAELVKEREFTEEAQKRVKQDMLFEIMLEKEKLQKAELAADLAKRRHEKEVADYKAQLEMAAQRNVLERQQTVSAQRTAEACRVESEHLEHLNEFFRTDLEELRQIDAEDKRARKDERRYLPPAYGNLNDEDRFPPYSQHADAGSIEIAHLKGVVRRKFERMVQEALAKPDNEFNMFCHLSTALGEISQDFRTILGVAKDVSVSRPTLPQRNASISQPWTSNTGLRQALLDMREELFDMREEFSAMQIPLVSPSVEWRNRRDYEASVDNRARNNERISTDTTVRLMRSSANAASYIADRILKVLLDLLWRTVSACELRSASRSTSKALYAQILNPKLAVMHITVDETFVAALRRAFSKSQSPTAFRYYLMQLEILARKFKALAAGMSDRRIHNGLSHFTYFSKTLAWLNEQVEKERELRANEVRTVHAEEMVEAAEIDDVEDDGVSSRWEGSAAGSSESEDE